MWKLLIEAIVVGIATAIIGTIVSWSLSKPFKVSLPPVCDNWNDNMVMEINLFLTGFIVHLLAEFTGVNRWYCSYGNACVN